MTEEEILDDWFNRDSNVMRLPIVAYDEPIYNFIITTCAKRGNNIYKVNDDWQRVILKKN